MREGWETKKLEEICNFSNGLWKGKKQPFIEVGVIRNTNFTKDCELDDSDIIFLEVEQSQFLKRKLEYGDIILEKSGGGPKQAVGRVVIFNKEVDNYSFSNFTSVIRIKDKQKVVSKYLHKYLYFLYLSGITEKMQSHSTGIRNLKLDEYKQIDVPIPNFLEQQRITAILEETFETIEEAKDNTEKNLRNANELIESYLNNVFSILETSREVKFDEVISDIITGPFGSMLHKSDYVTDGVPVVNPQNIVNGEIVSIQKTMIDQKTKERLNKYSLKEKDIVIARRGEMGRCAVVSTEQVGWLCGTGSMIIRLKEIVDEKYIMLILSTSRVKSILERESIGTTMNNLNQGILKNIEIAVPTLAEQRVIVSKFVTLSTDTKKLEAIYQKKLTNLEELKKSILQKAFNGEL